MSPLNRARWQRRLRAAVQALILVVLLMAVGTVGFIEYSAQPSFCTNCHNMQPYYDSWVTSTHNEVPCIRCHYAPGIRAEAMGKLQAANQVVKYITGTYGTKPWAEIEDAACLRSGCHSERKLEGELSFQGTSFDHRHHLTDLRRGKQLRCTSCHSQIVQGEHVAVTKTTCYLCHFRGRPPGDPIAGCTGCHQTLPRLVTEAGVVDHPRYVQDMVSCISCHEGVTTGSGEAEQARCFTCHNEPSRLERYDDVTLMHEVHLAEHNVECEQCHRPIFHEIVSLASAFDLDCDACHARVHEAQRRLYTGTGGHGSDAAPSSMYLARVSCQSCHGLPTELRGHEQVQAAGEATCLSCHGIKFANILPAWQREMERKTAAVASVVDAAERASRQAPAAGRARADSLLRLARENLELVRIGRGAHNIAYSDALLRAAVEFVREAVRTGELGYKVPTLDLGAPVGENICLRCHLGVETAKAEFEGAEFDHRPHVAKAHLPCSACHSSLEEHGRTILGSRATCSDCHHSGAIPCARCHEGTVAAPREVSRLPQGDFSHPVHLSQGLTCARCHGDSPSRPSSGLCATCHERHHQPAAECRLCHREGVKAKHPRVAHNGCAPCHGDAVAGIGEWSREVCTVCHADRAEHMAPAPCQGCHQQPALTPTPETGVSS